MLILFSNVMFRYIKITLFKLFLLSACPDNYRDVEGGNFIITRVRQAPHPDSIYLLKPNKKPRKYRGSKLFKRYTLFFRFHLLHGHYLFHCFFHTIAATV